MLGFVRDGDTVLVVSMDLLARNLADLRPPRPAADRHGRARQIRQ